MFFGVFYGAFLVATPIVLFGGSFFKIAKPPYKIAVLGNIRFWAGLDNVVSLIQEVSRPLEAQLIFRPRRPGVPTHFSLQTATRVNLTAGTHSTYYQTTKAGLRSLLKVKGSANSVLEGVFARIPSNSVLPAGYT